MKSASDEDEASRGSQETTRSSLDITAYVLVITWNKRNENWAGFRKVSRRSLP